MSVTVTANLQELLSDITPESPKVFYGVKWEDYVEFTKKTLDQTDLELTYNRGVLRVNMGIGLRHENLSRFLHNLITLVALQLNLSIIPSGSMSLVSKKVRKGADPDESYYIENSQVVGLRDRLFDEEKDIPPDLIVEIDQSHKSDEKFEIYASFGVKEFWLYDEELLHIFLLNKTGEYMEAENSLAFPILSSKYLTQILKRSQIEEQFKVLQDFQNWLAEQKK
jgi:Uma2 family endonuclease